MKISLKLKVCYVPVVVLFTVASSFVLDSSFGINAKSNVLQMTKSNEAWKENDRIYKLPGVSRMPKYAMYSGYLDSNNTNHVFYWYANIHYKLCFNTFYCKKTMCLMFSTIKFYFYLSLVPC